MAKSSTIAAHAAPWLPATGPGQSPAWRPAPRGRFDIKAAACSSHPERRKVLACSLNLQAGRLEIGLLMLTTILIGLAFG